jgi:predicted GNAT family acetyltransferase
MDESSTPEASIGRTVRQARNGVQTVVVDNAERSRFEALVDERVIGWQPYRRYKDHFVLMATEIDPQWRNRGMSTALIDGVLGLVRSAQRTVAPRCKLTGDYVFRHAEYRDLVPARYQTLVRQISRPFEHVRPTATRDY